MTVLQYLAAAVPSEIAGLPTWALNGLSIGGLVSFILIGLATSRLWTKRQVDIVREDHAKAVTELTKQHDREVANLKDRYETHLTRTVQLLNSRCDDALGREKEWREIATQLQQGLGQLADGLEPLHDQSETMLRIVTAWQAETRRKGDQP
jgi:X-X-X-Leu-X-X-Gly heptad repeat protein